MKEGRQRAKSSSGRKEKGGRYTQRMLSGKERAGPVLRGHPCGFLQPNRKMKQMPGNVFFDHDAIKLPLSVAYFHGVYLCSLPKVQCRRVIKLKRKSSARTERKEEVGYKGERVFWSPRSSGRWNVNKQVVTDLSERRQLRLSTSETEMARSFALQARGEAEDLGAVPRASDKAQRVFRVPTWHVTVLPASGQERRDCLSREFQKVVLRNERQEWGGLVVGAGWTRA